MNVFVSSKLPVAACAHRGKIDQFAVLIFAFCFVTEIIQLSGDFRPGEGRTASSCFALCLLAVFLFTFCLMRNDRISFEGR